MIQCSPLAGRGAPLACCGILAGKSPFVTAIYPLRNTAASTERYVADSLDLVQALRSMRERGDWLVAIYHCFPQQQPVPTRADRDENHFGDLPRVIVSLRDAAPAIRAWRLDVEPAQELPWRVVTNDGQMAVRLMSGPSVRTDSSTLGNLLADPLGAIRRLAARIRPAPGWNDASRASRLGPDPMWDEWVDR
jgi:[CysO sulfur-carrier protein]-S-L-cysteine hydrolase